MAEAMTGKTETFALPASKRWTMLALLTLGVFIAFVDYVPCWRTAVGTGEGMGFMYWDASQ